MRHIIATLVILFTSIGAHAELTVPQYQALKAAILADTSLDDERATGDMQSIATAFSAPDGQKCWDSDFTLEEMLESLNYTTYIGRSVAERDALRFMFVKNSVDTRRANVRQGFLDIFSGAAGATQRAALQAAAQRDCLRIETLFASGSVAGAYITTYEGPLGWPDVARALTEF